MPTEASPGGVKRSRGLLLGPYHTHTYAHSDALTWCRAAAANGDSARVPCKHGEVAILHSLYSNCSNERTLSIIPHQSWDPRPPVCPPQTRTTERRHQPRDCEVFCSHVSGNICLAMQKAVTRFQLKTRSRRVNHYHTMISLILIDFWLIVALATDKQYLAYP